jgi:hypothetical protein
VVQDKAGGVRDFFASENSGYILFPNMVQGRVVDLQGRAYPTPPRRSTYLNRPLPIHHLYNAGDAGQRSVPLRGDSRHAVRPRGRAPEYRRVRPLRHRAAGRPAWLPLFRKARRVYVALDRDATDRAIALARTFGTRGRVLIPPEELGPRGDLNDWLRVGAKGDPAVFRTVLERVLAMSPTPWALQIQRLPSDLAPWDLEDYPGVRDLLCEVGHHGRSVAMRTCALWRSGTESRWLLFRRRPGSLLRAPTPSCRREHNQVAEVAEDAERLEGARRAGSNPVPARSRWQAELS